MNNITLTTNNHDADGTQSIRTADKKHVQLVIEYILVQDTVHALNSLCGFKLMHNTDEDLTQTIDHLKQTQQTQQDLFKQLVELNVFKDNKWDLRTKWSSEF